VLAKSHFVEQSVDAVVALPANHSAGIALLASVVFQKVLTPV
jgi:hypothetical protein